MKVKFNKDAILKHRFWIMLGVTMFLGLVGIIYLELAVNADSVREDLLKALNASKTKKGEQNQGTIQKIADKAADAKKLESTIWADAYQAQAKLFTWPKEMEATYDFARGKFAVEIKVSKMEPAMWPPDSETLIHGTFVDQGADWLKIKPRKGEAVTFQRTDEVVMVSVTDENKQVVFGQLPAVATGKMVAVVYQTGRYFNDVLTLEEERAYKASYKNQIHDILKTVDPVDEKLDGVVQLRDWLYKPDDLPPGDAKFFRHVAGEFVKAKRVAWIAQEDLWIQKEIFRMIAEANKDVSDYKPIPDAKSKGPRERNKAYAFKNPNFQVELILDAKDNLSFKIKNLLDRKQSIDLTFRVLLNDTKGFQPEILRVSGKPLNPKGTAEDFYMHEFKPDKSPRNAILSVQQVLSWQTAAVKRIDQVTIGSNGDGEISHSHRTYEKPLRPFDTKDIGDAKPVVGGGAVGGFGEGKRPPKGMLGGGGAGGNLGGLENGLWSFRYDDVTTQYRRIPIGVVLIVDQEHVDRVLTSFNNSKLRFLPTQVLLNQYSGSLQPPVVAKEGGNPGGFPFIPGGEFGVRPKIGGPGEPAASSGSSDMDANMELVIYGLMTLYQRYPPAPRAAVIPTEKKN